MKRKSTNYSTPDSGGWTHACDSLFLAQFRGRPCEVCGATHSFYNNRTVRSHGHHLLSKELHRIHRYTPENIVVLCPKHHLGAEMSPHSHDGAAQKAFYDWLSENKPEKSLFMDEHRHDKFNKEWGYREKYIQLGGNIIQDGPMKTWKPKNHAGNVRAAEEA